MQMTPLQVTAELERKKRLGYKPDNPANQAKYDKLGGGANAGSANAVDPLGAGNSYVRKTLLDNGFANNDIGYDNTRKMVTLKGNDFLSPTRSINGSSIAGSGDISSALSNFRNTEEIKKRNDLMGRLEKTMEKPYQAPEFDYNPETDPVYQAALRRAQANAGTASGNATAEMNRRGILNSTITGDRIAQIQQSEYGRVSDEILPQLFQQAYGRYRDTVGDGREDYRNKIGDLGDLAAMGSDFNQRDQTNAFNERGFNYGVGRDKLEDTRYTDETKYNRGQDKIRNDLDRSRESRISSGGGSSGSSGGGGKAPTISQLLSAWKASGIAPPGLESVGIQPGTVYKPEPGGSDKPVPYDQMPEWSQEISAINKDPQGYYDDLLKNSNDYISTYTYDGYQKLLSQAKSLID